MGYLGRRIGVSQAKAAPSSSDGAGGTGWWYIRFICKWIFSKRR